MHTKKFKKKFNKSLALAIAIGVSVGGFQVPVAGATAGYDGGQFQVDYDQLAEEHPNYDSLSEEELLKLLPGYIKAHDIDGFAKWGYKGGYYKDVVVPNGKASGFATRSQPGMTVKDTLGGFGPEHDILTLRNKGVNRDRVFSKDVQKVLYVTYAIVNDIAKDDGLSDANKRVLSAAGYKGDYGKSLSGNVISSGIPHYFYESTPESLAFPEGHPTPMTGAFNPVTPADAVAEAAAIMAGLAISADTNSSDSNSGVDKLATFDDIEKLYKSGYSGEPYGEGYGNGTLEGTPELGNAILRLARLVSDEELENSKLYLRWASDKNSDVDENDVNTLVYYPVFFDLTMSKPADVEDLTLPPGEDSPAETPGDKPIEETPVETPEEDEPTEPEKPTEPAVDLHIINVRHLANGDYEVTRSDNKIWTIELSDIKAKLKELDEQKADKAELEKLNAELDELKEQLVDQEKQLEELKANNASAADLAQAIGDIAANKAEIERLTQLIESLTSRVDKIDADIVDHTAQLEKLIKDLDVVTQKADKNASDIAALTERVGKLEKQATSLEESVNTLSVRVAAMEAQTQQLQADMTGLNKRIDNVDARFTQMSKRMDSMDTRMGQLEKSNQCYASLSKASMVTSIVGPLLALAGANSGDMNTQLQKQLGIFNPEMAKMAADNKMIISALGAVAALLAGLGFFGYIKDKCEGVDMTKPVETKSAEIQPADKTQSVDKQTRKKASFFDFLRSQV